MVESWLCQEYQALARRVDDIATTLARNGFNIGEQPRFRGNTWEISKYRIAQWDPDNTTLPLSADDSYVQMKNGNLEIRGGQFDIHTGESGARMQMDGSGMKAWDAGGTKTLDIDFTTGNITITGTIHANAGDIAGWNITTDTIQKLTSTEGIILDSTNEIIKVGDTDDVYISIDGNNRYIGLSNFVSGHRGWRIDDAGRAEFLDIVARGKIQTSVFEKETVSAVNGEFLVTQSSATLGSDCTIDTNNLVVEDPSDGAWAFYDNDVVRIKAQAEDGNYYDVWLTVTRTATTNEYTYTRENGTTGVTFGKGTTVVGYGTSSEGGLIFSATDTYAPFLDIFNNTVDPWNGTDPKVRLGKLDGITDPTFGALSGYGLWTENGFFTGTLKATNGEIGNLDIVDTLDILSGGEIRSAGNYRLTDGKIFIQAKDEATEPVPLVFTPDVAAGASGTAAINAYNTANSRYMNITAWGDASYNSSFILSRAYNNAGNRLAMQLHSEPSVGWRVYGDGISELRWNENGFEIDTLWASDITNKLKYFDVGYNGDFFLKDVNSLEHEIASEEGPTSYGWIFKETGSDANTSVYIKLYRSRGDVDSPTAVQDSDALSSINFGGYDGSAWIQSAYISSTAEANWGTGDHTTKLIFAVTPVGTASTSEVMSIRSEATGYASLTLTNGGRMPSCNAYYDGSDWRAITDGNATQAYTTRNYGYFQWYIDPTWRSAEDILSLTNYMELGDAYLKIRGDTYPFVDNTYSCGTNANEWTEVWAYNTTIQHSDARDKRDIQNEPLGLNFIRRLKPRQFRWNEGKRGHHGFIGQEIKRVLDDLNIDTNDAAMYVYSPDTDRHHLRYGEFIAPLTRAVQELDEKNQKLKNKMEELEIKVEELEELERRVEDLERNLS